MKTQAPAPNGQLSLFGRPTIQSAGLGPMLGPEHPMEERSAGLEYLHRRLLLVGRSYLRSIAKQVGRMPAPEGLIFIKPKCFQLQEALEKRDSWPSENAIEWVERFVRYQQNRARGLDGYARTEAERQTEALRFEVQVFRGLREMDRYLSEGDLDGFEERAQTLHDHGEVGRIVAFLIRQ